MRKKKKSKQKDNTITFNKKARHGYFIEDTYEGGVALEGWEVKSLRAGRVQLKESYIRVINNEIFLLGAHISALGAASTHVVAEPLRARKILLHREQITKLVSLVERKGYTLVPLSLYWVRGRVKVAVGLAKGKKQHDKRATIKDREWKIAQSRTFKSN